MQDTARERRWAHVSWAGFLEFYTQQGRKTLLRHADLAGVTLELWDGPLALRWGAEADATDPARPDPSPR